MNYSYDENIVALDAVNNPIAVNEVFADLIIIKLWNNASGVRERLELSRTVEQLTTARV